jgi:hypothetical protein
MGETENFGCGASAWQTVVHPNFERYPLAMALFGDDVVDGLSH